GELAPPVWPELEEMPDVEIDIDDLLDAANEEERALKLQVMLFSNFKLECGMYLGLYLVFD
uniref:Uncharacterized protein n=1 Tax=Bubo bubo TaxID=30461 RepID=A0A8C0FVB6_BUBBB